jgi:hypothetical protein
VPTSARFAPRRAKCAKQEATEGSKEGKNMRDKDDNVALLFNHRDRKTKDTDCDYSGFVRINGQEYWLNGWINTSKKGEQYLSLKVRPKEAKAMEPREPTERERHANFFDGFDRKI